LVYSVKIATKIKAKSTKNTNIKFFSIADCKI